MAQVRLDPDVESALRALGERDGVSLAQVANRRLRHALGLTRGQSAPAGVTATVGRGTRTAPGECRHPIGRRIGAGCGACGAMVVRR